MEEGEAIQPLGVRFSHIKKRALKNKSLSVSFDEKKLKDFVTGFHKRKKKRRKEAQIQLQEAERRKRLEARKKRRLEREFVLYGGPKPDSNVEPGESGKEEHDSNVEKEQIASVSGTTMYDNGNMRVTVMTSEISRDIEDPSPKPQLEEPQFVGDPQKEKHNLQVRKKKPFKKIQKKRSQPNPQNRGKRKSKKH